MSIHKDRAIIKAREMGAYAGEPDCRDIWDLSKRELVEVALRLAERSNGASIKAIAEEVRWEIERLRINGII